MRNLSILLILLVSTSLFLIKTNIKEITSGNPAPPSLFSQSADTLFNKAEHFKISQKFDSASFYFDLAANKFYHKKRYNEAVKALHLAGYSLFPLEQKVFPDKYNKAYTLFRKALQISKKYLSPTL